MTFSNCYISQEQHSIKRMRRDTLEDDFIECRKRTQIQMNTFMEEDVYGSLCKLANYRMSLETKLKQSNNVSFNSS